MFRYILCLGLLSATMAFGQNSKSARDISEVMLRRTIPEAKLGDLICLDDYGNYTICSGDEFEMILGFCTNVPFITVNKVKGENKITEQIGVASFAEGKIREGDYLCACKENAGQVVRCSKEDYPYAKALQTPDRTGELFKVKILGHRRKH